ncbi:MAG TPA: hypothetical protein VFG07_09600 [Thermoplasmata archaeon]|nr:hypothetical protein [Thermoplasmata archaeon]
MPTGLNQFNPPSSPPSGIIQLGGKSYTFVTHSLFGNESWLNYSFQGVTFGFHLWCNITANTGYVCGHATEPSGATFYYTFVDGLPQANPPWQTWVSPDSHEAVQYQEGGAVHLLVAL